MRGFCPGIIPCYPTCMPAPLYDWYVKNVSGLANWVGAWIPCNGLKRVSFNVNFAAAGSTAGTLYVEGTDFPVDLSVEDLAKYFPSAPAPTLFNTPLNITVSHGTWPTTVAAGGRAEVVVANPPGFVRLGYTFSAGGALAQFNVFRNSSTF